MLSHKFMQNRLKRVSKVGRKTTMNVRDSTHWWFIEYSNFVTDLFLFNQSDTTYVCERWSSLVLKDTTIRYNCIHLHTCRFFKFILLLLFRSGVKGNEVNRIIFHTCRSFFLKISLKGISCKSEENSYKLDN